MWFHCLQPGQTWFSSLTFHQFQYFFFIKLFSLVFSSILLLILTHNPSTFCPLHLHSSPLYQITNLINLTLSISPPFIRSCDVSSLRLKLFLCLLRLWLMLVSPELFPSKFICENVFFCFGGGFIITWGRGNGWCCADRCHVNGTFTDGRGWMPAGFIDLNRIPHLYKMVFVTEKPCGQSGTFTCVLHVCPVTHSRRSAAPWWQQVSSGASCDVKFSSSCQVLYKDIFLIQHESSI